MMFDLKKHIKIRGILGQQNLNFGQQKILGQYGRGTPPDAKKVICINFRQIKIKIFNTTKNVLWAYKTLKILGNFFIKNG
jgi:hypothetical protein